MAETPDFVNAQWEVVDAELSRLKVPEGWYVKFTDVVTDLNFDDNAKDWVPFSKPAHETVFFYPTPPTAGSATEVLCACLERPPRNFLTGLSPYC